MQAETMGPVWESEEIELFEYPEIPGMGTDLSERFAELFPRRAEAKVSGSGAGDSGERASARPNASSQREPSHQRSDAPLDFDVARLVAFESQQAEERGRSKGFEMGLAAGRDEAVRSVQSERDRLHSQIASLIASFAEERDRYFHQVEQDAVRLAMAIAARILRREAQMDPLLLTGAVRVALGQLAQSTSVRLRVPAQDQSLWEEALARMPGLALRPEVVCDSRMELGECRMETELGSADLGLWSQMREIEKGFFDRVGDRHERVRSSSVSAWKEPETESGETASASVIRWEEESGDDRI